MSRSKAKETLDMDEFTKSMHGIYTTCIGRSTIDESPMVLQANGRDRTTSRHQSNGNSHVFRLLVVL